MSAALLRLLLVLWKPLAALLGGGALYAKGRADAGRAQGYEPQPTPSMWEALIALIRGMFGKVKA